jgi:hypothetical protein
MIDQICLLKPSGQLRCQAEGKNKLIPLTELSFIEQSSPEFAASPLSTYYSNIVIPGCRGKVVVDGWVVCAAACQAGAQFTNC